jgi:hypothetical protein
VDRLFLVGMIRNDDIKKLLIMIHPETWDPTFDKGIKPLAYARMYVYVFIIS